MDLRNSRVALATDNGNSVSSHFGRAQYYEVVDLVDGKVVRRERREKPNHHSLGRTEGDHNQGNDGREAHEGRNQATVYSVTDCQAMIVRGMGQGAMEHLRQVSLFAVLTGLHTIDEVVGAISSGTPESDIRRVHHYHGDVTRT